MKARILALLGALTLAIGLGTGTGEAAHAQSSLAFCTSFYYCLNAWNGGPYVNVYTPGVQNDLFGQVTDSDGYSALSFVGDDYKDPYDYTCVSDYGNSPTDARAGLTGNCVQGQVAWGANFTTQTCNAGSLGQGMAYKNVHWGGYLGPASESNGAAFYLNTPTPYCFVYVSG